MPAHVGADVTKSSAPSPSTSPRLRAIQPNWSPGPSPAHSRISDDLLGFDEGIREVLGLRKERREARVLGKRLEVLVHLDLRHVELPGRLRLAQPFERGVGLALERVADADVVEGLRARLGEIASSFS